MPEITDVNEAYFGLLPFSEYKKLIMDDDGKILNVFQDNIRDFQGENDVNDAIPPLPIPLNTTTFLQQCHTI